MKNLFKFVILIFVAGSHQIKADWFLSVHLYPSHNGDIFAGEAHINKMIGNDLIKENFIDYEGLTLNNFLKILEDKDEVYKPIKNTTTFCSTLDKLITFMKDKVDSYKNVINNYVNGILPTELINICNEYYIDSELVSERIYYKHKNELIFEIFEKICQLERENFKENSKNVAAENKNLKPFIVNAKWGYAESLSANDICNCWVCSESVVQQNELKTRCVIS